MNAPYQSRIHFDPEQAVPLGREAAADEPLMLDLDGWEGPLHVLLELARAQKVDLLALSVTRLADQFLAFVRAAKGARFALAADYLVMAAWLAYLKSRLLLPKTESAAKPEEPAEEVARRLAARLVKLDAVRRASAALDARPALRRDVFPRGDPQATTIVSHDILEGDLNGLMEAYVKQRRWTVANEYRPPVTEAWKLEAARDHLRRALPRLDTWTALAEITPAAEATGPGRSSLIASTLSAGLEFVKDGEVEMRQSTPFAALYLRARVAA